MEKKVNKDSEHTPISSLGEFGLIERIQSKFPIHHKSTNILGIGDDAAIIDSQQELTVVSTDMLIESIHFNLSYMPLPHLGYKAVTVNISDIVAMNAIPKSITVSIGISNRFSVEAIDALYEGIQQACNQYNVDLIGGDTCSVPTGLTISITAIGHGKKDTIVKRTGGKINEIICLTGDLAGAYMGLQVLEREYTLFKSNNDLQPKLENYNYIVGRQLKPHARMDVIHQLKDVNVIPTSMIDISDGLASELMHLSKQNQLGVHVYEKEVPIAEDTFNAIAEFNLSPMTCALNGGEDYELLFSIKQEDMEKVKKTPDISIIGHYTDKTDQCILVNKTNQGIPIKAQGWNHFQN